MRWRPSEELDGGSVRIAVIAQTPTFANEALVRVGCHGADWLLLTPTEALETLSPGDCAIGRIDVLPTLDGVDRDGPHSCPCVRDDVGHVIAIVDARLENDHALAGDLGPAQAPDHLLALAGEHRPADHLEPPTVLGGNANHGARGYYPYRSDSSLVKRR